jgi:hypothetical protein
MTMGRHRGNNAEEIAGAKEVSLFFLHNLHFLTYPDLPGADNIKAFGPLLAFHNDIGVFIKIYNR